MVTLLSSLLVSLRSPSRLAVELSLLTVGRLRVKSLTSASPQRVEGFGSGLAERLLEAWNSCGCDEYATSGG